MFKWLRKRNAPKDTYTGQVLDFRHAQLVGAQGVGELTATVQTCVGYWESGLSLAKTDADLLTPRVLSLMGRSLGLHGEAVFLIQDDGLFPAAAWDVTTRDGIPTAYRLTMPDTGGGRSLTALAPEVLHVVIGANPHEPWVGTAPLRRASLTTGMLHALESSLQAAYSTAPLGSQVVPFPENPEVDNEQLARSFRGQRGRVLLRESVNATAAGGPAPVSDWKPSDLSPDLQGAVTSESLDRARNAVLSVYGILPSLVDSQAAGPSVREGQRHLAQWMLQPIAAQVSQEASAKLGQDVNLDIMEPLQAYDSGARARALNGVVQAMAAAKEAGLSEEQVAAIGQFAGVQTD